MADEISSFLWPTYSITKIIALKFKRSEMTLKWQKMSVFKQTRYFTVNSQHRRHSIIETENIQDVRHIWLHLSSKSLRIYVSKFSFLRTCTWKIVFSINYCSLAVFLPCFSECDLRSVFRRVTLNFSW